MQKANIYLLSCRDRNLKSKFLGDMPEILQEYRRKREITDVIWFFLICLFSAFSVDYSV